VNEDAGAALKEAKEEATLKPRKEIVNGIALNRLARANRHHGLHRVLLFHHLAILENLLQGRVPRSHGHHDGDTRFESHYGLFPGVQ
jgi:hypothetical protein